jgi:hypothetical protein
MNTVARFRDGETVREVAPTNTFGAIHMSKSSPVQRIFIGLSQPLVKLPGSKTLPFPRRDLLLSLRPDQVLHRDRHSGSLPRPLKLNGIWRDQSASSPLFLASTLARRSVMDCRLRAQQLANFLQIHPEKGAKAATAPD